ncbi:hypothetical protein [Marinobacter daepoensis]|uniref:hypothetical protein n=1 Tax=Marinobacter daepoensis TaxID=262077 RepID=UPI0004006064|nr:hypothetical protein [Marinobacter daepoensis]MBY6031698.1 hypothetical protein [Marinobacter daepoensis]
MEPIRPDNDELRAEGPIGGAEAKPARARKDQAREYPASKQAGTTSGGGAGSRKGGRLMGWLVAIAFAGAAGAGWYAQGQRISALEGQLEEADYWARQSKLALARFEGELSETGESLQERGASLEEMIAANADQMKTANSEIRKLWVVANERNRKQLEEQGQKLSALDQRLAEAGKSVSELGVTIEKVRAGVSGDVAQLTQKLDSSVAALEQASQEADAQLTRLSQQIGSVDQVVESRIRRFEQEQKLGIDGIESRLSAIESRAEGLAGAKDMQAMRNRVAELARTVEAIDASRAQLTSRLVRLSDEVNELRASVGKP